MNGKSRDKRCLSQGPPILVSELVEVDKWLESRQLAHRIRASRSRQFTFVYPVYLFGQHTKWLDNLLQEAWFLVICDDFDDIITVNRLNDGHSSGSVTKSGKMRISSLTLLLAALPVTSVESALFEWTSSHHSAWFDVFLSLANLFLFFLFFSFFSFFLFLLLLFLATLIFLSPSRSLDEDECPHRKWKRTKKTETQRILTSWLIS